MIGVSLHMDILVLHKQGLSIRDIARQTGLSRNTVRKVLRGQQGWVAEVIEQLRHWQGRIGLAPPGEELPARDPRQAVADALSYFGHNEGRMRYPEYRRAGLPVTSSLVESLVGEVNARVKSKQKYWNRGEGAEAILQLRAAVLSEDGRLDRYLSERPGSPYRRRQKQGEHRAPAKVAA